MPSLEIKQLYNLSRFPDSSTKFLSIILYFPFGIVLAGVRTILGLLILSSGYILPNVQIFRNVLNRLLCFTFGISINIENPQRKEEVDAFVSNQVSVLDHLVLNSVTGCMTPGIKLPPLLSSAFGIKDFGSVSNLGAFKKNLLDALSQNKEPLFFQPEAHLTNGKGILKFNSTLPFEICNKIQPVAIRTCRPIFDLSVTTVDTSYWTDLFCYLFTPCTTYHVRFLPILEKKGFNEVGFTEEVRTRIANALKIKTVDFSANDLKEWEKRYKMERERQRQIMSSNLNSNPELHRMTLQVREVLPLVPYNVVFKDLSKTRNVDITITNILEGHIPYVPETMQVSSSPVTKPDTTNNTPSSSTIKPSSSQEMFNTAASSFGKNSQDRALSFQERKQLLIANARKRYIEKHNLQNLVLNNC